MLSLESPTAKMYRLASTSVNGEPYLSLDEMLATVAALTADDMAGAAAEFFAPDRQTVVSLGPTEKTPRRQDPKGGA
jgi:predicted Zn-dependent peptidase